MSASTLSQQVPLNRREFLTLAWLASLGFILVDIGSVAYLFAWQLEELAFHVIYLSASDAREDGSFGPEFDHLAAGAILSTTI